MEAVSELSVSGLQCWAERHDRPVREAPADATGDGDRIFFCHRGPLTVFTRVPAEDLPDFRLWQARRARAFLARFTEAELVGESSAARTFRTGEERR
jgi:hypothetical protein